MEKFLLELSDIKQKITEYESWLETGKASKYHEVPATLVKLKLEALRLIELCNEILPKELGGE